MIPIDPNDETKRLVTLTYYTRADRSAISDDELIARAGKIVARAWVESDADPARFARIVRRFFVVECRDDG